MIKEEEKYNRIMKTDCKKKHIQVFCAVVYPRVCFSPSLSAP